MEIQAKMGEQKWPQAPAPSSSLMIRGVARAWPAEVVALIARFACRKAAQTIWRKQALRAKIDHGFLLLQRQRPYRQRHRKNLIGPHRGIIANPRRTDDDVTTTVPSIPEFLTAVLSLPRKDFVPSAPLLPQSPTPLPRFHPLSP